MVNILCIDNSKTIREVIKDCVLDLGYNFFEASDGESGVKMANEIENLKMVIVDWNMPLLSGKETLIRLREIKKLADTLCLVLIRIENKEDVIEALQLGAHNYMLKPFSVNKLQDKIKEMIKDAA